MSDHAFLSPSSSHIWLKCTPSARFASQYPDEGSVYAEEGTEAHALAEHKLKSALGLPSDDPRPGMKYLTSEMEECTDDYVTFVLENAAKMTGADISIEQKVSLEKWVPGCFGHADCILAGVGELHVIDLKYGTGVPVNAEMNPQFLMYALGALENMYFLFDIRTVTVTAFQPRLSNISSFSISKDELLSWAEGTLKPGAALAWEGDGTYAAGEHCRFCRAKAVCRTRAERNLELARYDFAPPAELTNLEIAAVLERADELAAWAKDVREHALAKAVSGEKFDGWKLVAGRSVRKFSDEAKAADAALAAGYDPYEKSLMGITALEKLMGRKKFGEVMAGLVVKPKGKPTLVPETDKRHAVDDAADDFNDTQEKK